MRGRLVTLISEELLGVVARTEGADLLIAPPGSPDRLEATRRALLRIRGRLT